MYERDGDAQTGRMRICSFGLASKKSPSSILKNRLSYNKMELALAVLVAG
jgi:hypothetical protein